MFEMKERQKRFMKQIQMAILVGKALGERTLIKLSKFKRKAG
jgi:hypothetical protein